MSTSLTNNEEITVSVLVPVYNTGASLRRCLESLAAQTCKGLEFICINDGSTDNSPEELEAWASRDKRFRIIHQPNGGYGKAMNAGLSTVRGAYIGIVEPDDWIEADMYENLYTLAINSGADICKANYCIERKRGSAPNYRFERFEEGSCVTPLDLPEYLKGSPSIWSAIYRSDFLKKHNILFSETPGAAFQDLGFCIRTWLAAKSICITHIAPYHYWEDNPVSSSRRMEDGAWAAYKEIEQLEDVLASIPHDAALIRSIMVLRIFATLKADYRLRIRGTIKSFLLKYSHLLKRHFPIETLQKDYFSKDEWCDIQLIYNTPLLFPRKSRTCANLVQRICSCRTEAGRRVLRIMGMHFIIPMRRTTHVKRHK